MSLEKMLLPATDMLLQDARGKLAGWHFSKEALSSGERQILYVAEALLRFIDTRAATGEAEGE